MLLLLSGKNDRDISTCGSEQTTTKRKELEKTPTSRVEQPIASREPGNGNKANGNRNYCDEVDAVICRRSTRNKRNRKTSTVRESILQYVKRQKSLAP
ncbi:hypothetical protein FNV43_RR25778 [Rhamnella rubrinervis]|uniref:Uncharacterized protein n=1 Tax=Rhamnella rubrinervis TaxID=2594499 RepID=A0A8K0DLE2_9ROSA|nr:hypothetical protein FNV43_RR25778 [Rhamnella rubrinervis]